MNTLFAHKGRGAHAESHAHRGFVDVDCRQCLRVLSRSYGIADGYTIKSRNRYDVSSVGFGDFNPLHAAEHEDTLNVVRTYFAIARQQGDIIPHPQRAIGYAANGHLAQVVVVVQSCHEHL